jgi:hypothetical protein
MRGNLPDGGADERKKIMKRLVSVLIISVLVLSACGAEQPAAPPGNAGENNTTTTTTTTAIADIPNPPPANESRTFTKDFDGVVLTVTLEKSVYAQDDIINITTSVRNDTNELIVLQMPFGDAASNTDIRIHITGDGINPEERYYSSGEIMHNYLIDIDTSGVFFSEEIGTVHIEAGEEYTKVQRFETYYKNYESERTLAPAGEYVGTARIILLSDPYDNGSLRTTHILDFELEIR